MSATITMIHRPDGSADLVRDTGAAVETLRLSKEMAAAIAKAAGATAPRPGLLACLWTTMVERAGNEALGVCIEARTIH